MKAMVRRTYGPPDILRLEEVPKPGLRVPKHTIIGTDIAGRIEAVGGRVTQFKPGDHVFGELSRAGFGGYAEYVVAPETGLALKPSNASFEEAAALQPRG